MEREGIVVQANHTEPWKCEGCLKDEGARQKKWAPQRCKENPEFPDC